MNRRLSSTKCLLFIGSLVGINRPNIIHRLILSVAWVLLWSFWGSGSVQADAPVNVPPPSGPVQMAPALSVSYKLGPADSLSIKVLMVPAMDTEALILEDGTITLPRIGSVYLQGKTLAEAQESLRKALEKVFVKPEVSITIKKPREEFVYVSGGALLGSSGRVDYREGLRISQALAKAGGLKFEPRRIMLSLIRKDGSVQALSAEEILKQTESPDNVRMSPGDVLIANEVPAQPIYILGAVAKPGMYDLRDINAKRGSVGVVEALALAGGPTKEAALSKAFIDRGESANSRTVEFPTNSAPRRRELVNLVLLQPNDPIAPGSKTMTASSGTISNLTPNEVLLYPGDTLQIPESTAKIAVTGFVMREGVYPLSEDHPMTLIEALALAGGPQSKANLKQVGIIRVPDPSKIAVTQTSPTLLTADVKALRKGDLRENVVLRPGDVVYVPGSTKTDWLGKVVPSLSSVAQILFLGGVLGR